MRKYILFGPRGHVIGKGTADAIANALPSILKRWKWFRVEPLPPSPLRPKPVLMFDAVTVANIPLNAAAVAGYVNGKWVTYPKLVQLFPKAHLLSIAVSADFDADCLDVEAGDATPDQAAAWVRRQQKRGSHKPVVYTSISNAETLLKALLTAGVSRSDIRLWTAHYTGKTHRCTLQACGFECGGQADATQYTDQALGRSLDASICAPGFFD